MDDEFGYHFDSVASYSLPDTGATLDEILPYSVAQDSAQQFSSNQTVSGFSMPASSGNFLKNLQSGIDYGLKVSGTLRAGELASQAQNLQGYLAQSKMGILRTQAESDAEVAKIKATAAANMSKIYANAAGSGANLAALGGTKDSLMLYLTIAGVALAFIQVLNQRK
jgi:hypothetical protein